MGPGGRRLAKSIALKLSLFSEYAVPGISSQPNRDVLALQIVESIRRVEYVHLLKKNASFDHRRTDPQDSLFDPLKAALIFYRQGDIDEAFWLVFLSAHCGKHVKEGWRLTREIYGALGAFTWTWHKVSANPQAFTKWMQANAIAFESNTLTGKFGNHRRYCTNKVTPGHKNSTWAAVESYVKWVGANRGHALLIEEAVDIAGGDAAEAFDHLYQAMRVDSFSRLGKFDFLTMIGKIGFAPIEPGIPYLQGATGPLRGARLLFAGGVNDATLDKSLEAKVVKLGEFLGVGMQVMEDSLCNWQKNPGKFIAFRG